MNEPFDLFNDWMQAHPHYGYLIAAVILAFWLLGVILGWKWTYESSTWKENTLREMLGDKGYRIGVGVLLAIALYCALSLFVHADRKAAKPTATDCQGAQTFNYRMESYQSEGREAVSPCLNSFFGFTPAESSGICQNVTIILVFPSPNVPNGFLS